MTKLAFLTCSELNPNSILDDHLVKSKLEGMGHQVSSVIWDHEKNWEKFDAVIVRTTWDYQQKSQLFFQTLQTISEQSQLYNPIRLMQWNGSKLYLKELAAKGIPTIPTLWVDDLTDLEFENICQKLNCKEFIIKPTIGAGSSGLHRIKSSKDLNFDDPQLNSSKVKMIQPFLPEIQKQGEFSLIFFNQKLSHAINKLPKAGEFRSQEEFGSQITSIVPDQTILKIAEQAVATLPHKPLYARVDLVMYEKQYRVIELELIEPNLYFSTHSSAADNFINALKETSIL
jgi:glutathione synthase/RimK-type ligase-like ATP-grasp enzyme